MRIDLASFAEALRYPNYKAFLLYGGDEALQRGILAEVRAHFATKTPEETIFLQDPDFFFMEDLFSAKQDSLTLIILYNTSEKAFPTYKQVIERLPANYRLILTNLTMRVSSACVKYFINTATTGAIPCYECTISQSLRIFRRFCTLWNLTFSDEKIFHRCAALTTQGNWEEIVKKLLLYTTSEPISSATLERLFDTEFPEHNLALLMQSSDLFKHFTSLLQLTLSEGIKIIHLWQQQLLQLWQFKIYIDQGLSFPEAEKNISPPMFFKFAPIARLQVSKLSLDALTKVMGYLHQAEVFLKKEGKVTAQTLQCLKQALLTCNPLPSSAFND